MAEAKCTDCGTVVKPEEGYYASPIMRCAACGDRLINGGFVHLGEQM